MLLDEEDQRLGAVLEGPHSALLGIDKLNAIKDRQDAVQGAQLEVWDEQERRPQADSDNNYPHN